MNYFPLLRTLSICFIAAALFTSCTIEKSGETLQNMTLQGSIDKANLRETGASAITYNPKTRENVIDYTDFVFLGLRGLDKGFFSADASAFTLPDSIAAAPKDQFSLSIRPGLEYIGKGAKFPGSGGNLNLNYLEIPIDVVAHYPAGPGYVHFGLGSYFAEGIGGGGANGIYSQDIGFKRFDAGLNFLLGYTFDNGIAIDFRYDLGLANVEYAAQDVSGHTRTFSFNVGYQIGRLFHRRSRVH